MFDKLIQVLVFGCGARRIADSTCSATTLRRRRDGWITTGVAEQLRLAVLLAADDPPVRPAPGPLGGGRLHHQGPGGGQVARPSPIDRRKQGLKRSVTVEADGMPLAAVPAPTNQRDDGLLAATLDAIAVVGPCRSGRSSTWTPVPTTSRAGRCWPLEPWPARSPLGGRAHHAWGNQCGKLRWGTERRRLVVAFWLALASAAIVCGRRIRRAWIHYRWDGRPRRRP